MSPADICGENARQMSQPFTEGFRPFKSLQLETSQCPAFDTQFKVRLPVLSTKLARQLGFFAGSWFEARRKLEDVWIVEAHVRMVTHLLICDELHRMHACLYLEQC